MEKRDWSQFPLINNTENLKKRFELHIDNAIAFIEYKTKENTFYLTHTEVPKSLGGLGVGKTMIKKILEYLRKNQHQLVPICPFVAIYLKRNPEAGEGLIK